MNIVLIQVLFRTTMDNSNSYLDQFVVENLDDIIVYSHSQEVWNPEYSIPGVAGKEAVRTHMRIPSSRKAQLRMKERIPYQ